LTNNHSLMICLPKPKEGPMTRMFPFTAIYDEDYGREGYVVALDETAARELAANDPRLQNATITVVSALDNVAYAAPGLFLAGEQWGQGSL
jgi:hypothetical protein